MALKHVSLCLVLFVSAQVCLAGPTTTPAPTTFFTLFGDLLESAQKTVVEAGKNIQQILGMPEIKDVNQVVATLQNASLEFSKTISDAIAKAKDQSLAPIQKQTEGLLHNFSQALADTKKDIGRYNASAAADLILQTLDGYMAKIQGQLEKEREILSRVEFKQFQNMVVNASASLVQQGVKAYEDIKKKVDPNAKALAETVQKFYTEVNKTTEELRKKIPELNATELQKAWTKSLKNLVDQASKLRETLEKETPEAQENLSKTVLGLLETVTKAANSFADKVHETVSHNEHPDHAKHHKN